jgi:hypothetical protein
LMLSMVTPSPGVCIMPQYATGFKTEILHPNCPVDLCRRILFSARPRHYSCSLSTRSARATFSGRNRASGRRGGNLKNHSKILSRTFLEIFEDSSELLHNFINSGNNSTKPVFGNVTN